MQPVYQNLAVLDLVPFGQTGPEPLYYALRLENPGWNDWRPGQFVMLRPATFGLEQIWGRPFSICHMTSRHMVCFFKIRGGGTKKISSLANGDRIAAWGPLGNYFAVEQNAPTLLLAGGIGLAPFVGYVQRHPTPWLLSMLFGHRDPEGCYPLDSIKSHIAVDCLRESRDGDLDNFIFTMHERMKDCASQKGLVLACGPDGFLRTVRRFALELGCSCQLSLENRMACGVGACLGCVCRTTGEWPVAIKKEWPVQVCTQGPVFWADQINL